jgi:outer membrane protein assembly factor BamA
VIATRLRADWLNHSSGTVLPFFVSQGLGGSRSLRSFSLNRFRGYDRLLATLEYRYGVLPGKLDAVAFWDTGGAYRSFAAFELRGLQHSFGAGVRILRDRKVLLRLEVAHGREGTRLLFSFNAPF